MLFGCCVKKVSDVGALKSCGYDYFEFSGTSLAAMTDDMFESLARESQRYDLPCLAINSYSAGRPAIVGPAFSAEDSKEYANKICSRAGRLGAKTIGIGAPKARILTNDYSIEKAMDECRKFLTITCEVASDYSITVLLEAVHSQACNFINYTEEAVDLVDSLSIPNLKLVLDFYHMEVMAEGLESVDSAAHVLNHTHISTCQNNLGRGFPQVDEKGKYTAILSKLHHAGYDRTMSVEPDTFEDDKARNCLAMLKSIKI